MRVTENEQKKETEGGEAQRQKKWQSSEAKCGLDRQK